MVMILFTLFACWNVVLIFMHCCFKHSSEEKTRLIGEMGEKKPEPKDFPDFPEEAKTEQLPGEETQRLTQ